MSLVFIKCKLLEFIMRLDILVFFFDILIIRFLRFFLVGFRCRGFKEFYGWMVFFKFFGVWFLDLFLLLFFFNFCVLGSFVIFNCSRVFGD